MAIIESAALLSLQDRDCGLVNPFSKKTANPAQKHDLLEIRNIGCDEFEKYVLYYILRQASVHPPQRKRDWQHLLKGSHLRGWLANLALANSDGTSLKGQKSYATKALKNRYKNSTPPVILNCLPSGWTPECCILEGMFVLNTQPLGIQRTFSYGNFLIKRYILPHFSSGTREVHVIFDSPGRHQQTPKYFERLRHDSTAPVNSNHTCDDFTSKHPIPSKWREGVINCHICKRNLVLYLTQFFLQQVPKYL